MGKLVLHHSNQGQRYIGPKSALEAMQNYIEKKEIED